VSIIHQEVDKIPLIDEDTSQDKHVGVVGHFLVVVREALVAALSRWMDIRCRWVIQRVSCHRNDGVEETKTFWGVDGDIP
jgi:hypothetical protein